MSTKKNKPKNKSAVKKSLFRENVEDRRLVRKGKERDNKKRKPAQLKQSVLDSFSFSKQAGVSLQDDISEESFNPPLHSTAVYTEDDDLPEKTKLSLEKSANQTSSGPSVRHDRSVRRNSSAQKNLTASEEQRSLASRSVEAKKQKTPQKTATLVQDLETAENGGSSESAGEKTGSTQQTPPAEPSADKKSNGKTKSKVEGKKSPNKNKSNKSKRQIQLTVWSPEDAPGTAKDVNELDVILFESEKLVEQYRESIDGACRKAVDNFFLSFKDQLTTSIKNVRILKDLKRNNAKVRSEIGRKQKRLIEVKDEIIKKQPRLNRLQRECSQLEERQRSSKEAQTFLDNLWRLQEGYRKCRAEKNPSKETFGLSSLPALILQVQNTMRAEQHFHNVSTQLQNVQRK